MDAVIAGAKQVDVWNEEHGTWEVQMALQFYESVVPLFEYLAMAGHHIH